MPFVILDTDFLSAFLKIERLSLIRQFYRVQTAWITPAVYQELVPTPLLPLLLKVDWLEIRSPGFDQLNAVTSYKEIDKLGAGERTSIALAYGRADAVLLCNDRKAGIAASHLNVQPINIPAFLLAGKLDGLLNREQLRRIIDDLWQKDYYKFSQEIVNLLLTEPSQP
jgi:predicted nucleic acid-binding protein